jgi:hypothetical protein
MGTNVEQLLKKQKLHINQLMLDERVLQLVAHVGDHAYHQGHNRGDPVPYSCKKCEELIVKLFPETGMIG